jgi:hypothetical protein
MNAVASRTLPQEHAHRWRKYWATKASECARQRLFVDLGVTIALVYHSGVLLAAFNHFDTPDDIDARLAELTESLPCARSAQ